MKALNIGKHGATLELTPGELGILAGALGRVPHAEVKDSLIIHHVSVDIYGEAQHDNICDLYGKVYDVVKKVDSAIQLEKDHEVKTRLDYFMVIREPEDFSSPVKRSQVVGGRCTRGHFNQEKCMVDCGRCWDKQITKRDIEAFK
jgi:hypothetical protein